LYACLGRAPRHHELNDVLTKAFSSAVIPFAKQPAGLLSSQGKRLDGSGADDMTGKPVVWDVTVGCTCADSYVDASAREAGAAGELAAARKMAKYSDLSDQ